MNYELWVEKFENLKIGEHFVYKNAELIKVPTMLYTTNKGKTNCVNAVYLDNGKIIYIKEDTTIFKIKVTKNSQITS